MKFTGVTIVVDDMGRILIPKKLRETMGYDKGGVLDIYIDEEDNFVMKKHGDFCKICGGTGDLIEFRGKKNICKSCINELKAII